jgi:sirohydrochlorin cobaltochelatase
MARGLILLAHGARDALWREPFERLLERLIVRRPGLEVRLAFLELMTPDLVTAGKALAAAGCGSLLVVPVFLGQGGHVRDDVPALVDALRKQLPGVAVAQSRTAGEDPDVLEALAEFCLRELED